MAVDKGISILGCGWLGLPLAKTFLRQGMPVKGSTTHPEKMSLLREEGIEPFLIRCDPQLSGENVEQFFESPVLVITIPFKRDLPEPVFYRRQIEAVINEAARSAKVRFVIFTSSTSVYPEHLSTAKEDDVVVPDNPRSATLLDIETFLLAQTSLAVTVVRLAGLYGGTRAIGKFLAGKKDLSGAHQPVNLIHQDDAVGIIAEIVRQDVRGGIFNACSDEHPTRKALYAPAASKMGLPPPQFQEEVVTSTKIVSNRKVKERLGYRFQYPDPMATV